MIRALALVVFALAWVAAGAASAGEVPECRAKEMTGRFAVVPGSAGAGNIVYALTLTNRSELECFVTGLPRVRLLGRQGLPIPTHALPAMPGATTAVIVRLRPGKRARATARFSPDVPGRGDRTNGPCQRTAYRLLVRLAGGGVIAPILPPTPVCSRGAMQLSVYTRA